MISAALRLGLAGLLAASALGGALAREPIQKEADSAFRIFLNVKEELVARCIYKPTEVAVLTGVLQALERELEPELAPYFPQKLDPSFPKAWQQAQKALIKLASLPELEKRTIKELVEQGLRGYVRTLDRYSEYDDLATYEREVALKSPPYVGVGMTLDRTLEGFDLYPFPTGPADLAGCFSGDRLIEVDGKPVRGLGTVEAGAMFSGPEHSEVKVKVRRAFDGQVEMVTMKREKIVSSFISVEQQNSGTVVRLRRFSAATVKDMRAFLLTAKSGQPLTIDLRNCHGGELEAAVAIAELFMPKDALVCKVETRSGSEVFRSANAKPFVARPLVLLQNKGTMSGAELVTVALVTSPTVRAESRGERSYGKGVTLVEVLVDDGGGRLRFADGRLSGPHGEFWDGEGLPPTTEDLRAK